MNLTHLVCAACGTSHPAGELLNLCKACGMPLWSMYDLPAAARTLTKESLKTREKSLWRYREVLPVKSDANIVTLGEGGTPLFKTPRLGARLGMADLRIKDEGQNPTASFKARGMTTAISMAKELGVKKLAVPSAGNAAGAMAAYAAKAGIEAFVFMPADTPRAFIIECQVQGAHVTLINGLITDCGAEVARRKQAEGWFDVSTLKEPYRLEGKKTLGYELAEQLDWQIPDVVIYPTGGGTGLVGMWKAFQEMEAMGWIGSKRPRIFSVQAAGCAPIVSAYEKGLAKAPEFPNAHTKASGLRVPKAIGDFIMLDAIRKSHGGVCAVTDEEMVAGVKEIGETEGMFVAPEGGACYAALKRLVADGSIKREEQTVIFNTGSGLKYLECFG
ncbi:threonine synthase [Oleiharenicola lentus]|uniref:threonine synthase n=1 Tax=Oleiharenicola lentus TaxID=2508720 RepID=UPI003F6809A6